MEKPNPPLSSKHLKFIKTLAEGLTSYITYESRCGMAPAYSEYLLYGPFVRICANKHWAVKSEELVDKKSGDYRRIDFHITKNESHLYLELKWIPNKKRNNGIKLNDDIDRLKTKKYNKYTEIYIFIIGNLEGNAIKNTLKNNSQYFEGGFVTAYDTTFTNYGVQVFKVSKRKPNK